MINHLHSTVTDLQIHEASDRNGIRPVTILTPTILELKVKVHTLYIAPLGSETPPQKRSGMVFSGNSFFSARMFSRDFIVLPAHPHVHLQSE